MRIEIEIPDDLIREAAERGARASLDRPDFRGAPTASAYKSIADAAGAAVAGLDVRSLVYETVRRRAQVIVEETVDAALRDAARKTIAEARKAGRPISASLFEAPAPASGTPLLDSAPGAGGSR